jgi:hypothetical protein
MALREGGRWQAPTVVSGEEASAANAPRVLSAVLSLELLWVLLVTASVVFLAAHLGPGSEEFTGDATVRGVLLLAAPPLAVVLGLALIGARQGVERRTASPAQPLGPVLRLGLWISALANVVVVISILTSLYHAHMTWVVVGILLAAGLSWVATACVRTSRAGRPHRVMTPRWSRPA